MHRISVFKSLLVFTADMDTDTACSPPPQERSIPPYTAHGPSPLKDNVKLPTDCILRVSSRRYFTDPHGETQVDPTPLPVRTLVGAFEDIGTSRPQLTRPLTIHVDSFSSDPFAHTAISSDALSPLKRSQSLQVLTPTPQAKPSKKPDKRFNIRTVSSSAQRFLKPYWKIKMDNTKQLIHSFSSAAIRPKDGV